MTTPEKSVTAVDSSWLEIDRFVAAYESCQIEHGHADINDFLPEPDDPRYRAVLRELVRVDLEYGWERGRAQRIEAYLDQFPDLKADRQSLQEISFEEFRLRQQAGEQPSPAEYRQRLGVDTRDWPAPLAEVPSLAPLPAPPDSKAQQDLKQAANYYLHHCRTILTGAGTSSSAARALPEGLEQAAVFLDLHLFDPGSAQRLAEALICLPSAGVECMGFQLVTELGRGAFSRVYLAHQGELAGRLVALKISSELVDESQTLARLQHTNIVPIYSVHRAGPLQALCMPYFGATTLAHVVAELVKLPALPQSGKWLVDLLNQRTAATFEKPGGKCEATLALLSELNYVDAVLWLAQRLAEALAHAHERGIVHSDLKPANVLLSDEGQPMLLDFNLSKDMLLRTNASAAYFGGTLPYMAPEHLQAFRAGRHLSEARSDVYALGLILYELFTGRYPFPLRKGPTSAVLDQMLQDRQGQPPWLRTWNPQASPACEAIVRRCLDPDRAGRYPSARALYIDLERQRMHLPLRFAREPSPRERLQKWMRRHPRLTSSYVVGAVAIVFVAILATLYGLRARQLTLAQAVNTLHEFRDDVTTSKFLLMAPTPEEIQEGLQLSRQALGRYGVLEHPRWESASLVAALPASDRDLLRDEVIDLLLLRASGLQTLSRPAASAPAEALAEALSVNELAARCAAGKAAQRLVQRQRASLLEDLGRKDEARALRSATATLPLQSARDLYLAGCDKLASKDLRQALALLKQANQADPQDAVIWYELGTCQARLGQHEKAAASFGTSIALSPKFFGNYLHRGVAYLEMKEYGQALADFDEVLRLRPKDSVAATSPGPSTAARLNRALARAGLKDYRGACADVTYVLEETADPPTHAYFMRSQFRASAGDSAAARADQEEGLKRRPTDALSFVTRGANRLAIDPAGALADFDEALHFDPDSLAAFRNKAHVLAEKLGRTAEAVQVLTQALEHLPDSVPLLAGRGVLLARLNRRAEALRDARRVLQLDHQSETLYQAACVYALTSRQQPGDRQEAFRLLALALAAGYGQDLVRVDTDLDPLRRLPEFEGLVGAAK